MAFFTILAFNILAYIRESLYLYIPTCFYKQLLNHLNITQIVNSIIKLKFKDLDIMIPKTELIYKRIVFINKIDDTITLVAYL